MTTPEKIVIFGGGGLFAYWLFTRSSTPLTSAHPASAQPEPSLLDKILNGLGKVAGGIGGGSGPGGVGFTSGSGNGSAIGGGSPSGPSSLESFFDNLTNPFNDRNFDGSLGSGPLSFSDDTTVDLNLVNPDTGETFFQVPDVGPSNSDLLASAYDEIDRESDPNSVIANDNGSIDDGFGAPTDTDAAAADSGDPDTLDY